MNKANHWRDHKINNTYEESCFKGAKQITGALGEDTETGGAGDVESEEIYYQNHDLETLIPSSSAPLEPPNLYTEFNNVAETFRSAFAQRLKRRNDDDITVLDSLTGAIVTVPEEQDPIPVPSPSLVTRKPPKPHERSSELVRITDVGPDGERQFREVVRKTKIEIF